MYVKEKEFVAARNEGCVRALDCKLVQEALSLKNANMLLHAVVIWRFFQS
jgi:hypothetical protein